MIRLRQLGILAIGLALAAVMVLLGIWQLDVYHAQGREQAERRAAQDPVSLASVAQPAAAIGDGYGRPVAFSGHYLPESQLLVPVNGTGEAYRVLSALQLDTGGVLPVVRGVVTTAQLPTPPTATETETGVLLPSEEAPPGNLPPGQLSSVRIPTLAQQWPGPLLTGYVTLSAADSTAQGLAAAPLELPQSSGRLRNGAYALQWWVFAAFAVAMAVKVARDQVLADPDEPDPDELDPGELRPVRDDAGGSDEVPELTADRRLPTT